MCQLRVEQGCPDAKVIANWRAKGTHLGPELGIPASGRRVDFTGLSVFEFTDGKITAGFDRWNRGEMIASLMQVRMDELRTHVGPRARSLLDRLRQLIDQRRRGRP